MKKLFGDGRLTEVAVGESFFDSLTITEAHFIKMPVEYRPALLGG